MMNWKGSDRCLILSYYPSIRLAGLRKATEGLRKAGFRTEI
jgi:hypothetical protein